MVRRAIIFAAVMIAGCGESVAPPAVSGLAAPNFGTATIIGRVKFIGTPPERKMIDTSTCQDGPRTQQEETIVVGEGGALRDVVVSLVDAPASDGSSQPQVTLDQVGCRYVPHVLALQVNQRLKITTSDGFFHNVHYTSAAEGDVNFGLHRTGESRVVSFDRAQTLRMECNVHPWMNASVAVVENPFFAVSDAAGRFTIARVPAGRFAVRAWHPLLGVRTASVEVAGDGSASLDIDFAPPK